MMASYLKSQWNPGVRIIFCFCCCFCCLLENKSWQIIQSWFIYWSIFQWTVVLQGKWLIGGWRPRLLFCSLQYKSVCTLGHTSNNSIIEVKFLSITWAELVIFWATLLLRFLTSGVAGWSSDRGIKSYDISDVC